MPSDSNFIDPYFRNDPGFGVQRMPIYEFDLENDFNNWKPWCVNDERVLPNDKSNFALIENPFGKGHLILLTTYYDPVLTGRPYGGFGMRAPINSSLEVDKKTFIEFDLYYSKSAAGKYMRFEFWSASSGGAGVKKLDSQAANKTQVGIRTLDLEGIHTFNIDYRCGYYQEETWYMKRFNAAVPTTSGKWEYLNIDLHTEAGAEVFGGVLMLGNIKITKLDTKGTPIPEIINYKNYDEVEPIKKKYNPGSGYFLMGTDGEKGVSPDTLGGYHFDLFVSHRNLKPERHINAPQWLKDEYRDFTFASEGGTTEWDLPTEYYKKIRDAGDYKLHGHCLAWINQSPQWMCQMVPENIKNKQWSPNGLFYFFGYDPKAPYLQIKKETARRIYFNHILYEMRHFMTTDARYDSSEERGIIPFHSFDVINSEIHESRHSQLIRSNPNEWKTSLKNVSWLVAMTDNDMDNIHLHYMYLLYKYAHIAVPNAQMAEKYKTHYNDSSIIPEYMKMDNNDNDGSIDAFVSAKPPILIYNDYEIFVQSKAIAIYNMIKELNLAWKADPLYDNRNLIECIGFQGHDTVDPDLISYNEKSIIMFKDLIDDDLLDSICFSELDLKQPETAPGGKALAPDILNEKQADTIGYQYALLFKLFDKYKEYIDHVTIWNQSGAGWANSYVLFDHEKKASQAYYAVMDPDKFINGHTYLYSYFNKD